MKLLDVGYQELTKRRERHATVEEFVQSHLDPVLKAADELVGKTYSLAQEDFSNVPPSLNRVQRDEPNIQLTSILFLFAQFWSAIEILRRESIYVRLADSSSGERLAAFIRCLESRRVRLVDRARQRAIGESLIVESQQRNRTAGYSEFIIMIRDNDDVAAWISPLSETVIQTKHASRRIQRGRRQRFLQYAVILHSLIDTLDPKHTTTRERPPQPNKLAPQTRRAIRARTFAIYLPFVREPQKYTEKPRK